MPRAILFDLDGTLVQTRESSWAVFADVNDEFDLGVKSQEAYFQLLEGNLFRELRRLAGSRADAVSQRFLDLLKDSYNPPFVPGMVDVVKALAGSCSLAVVSSNAMATIRRILEGAGLQHCFSHVFSGDVEADKRACVRRFLTEADYTVNRHCSPAYAEHHRPEKANENQIIMITDTVGDIKHAIECGVRAVGVSWGMHSEEKLGAAGAEFVAIWPQELLSHLFPNGMPAPACEVVPTAASARNAVTDDGCGCGGTSACSCAPINTLDGPRTIRRERRMAATARLERRLSEVGKTEDRLAAQRGPGTAASRLDPADPTLLDSLRRISQPAIS